MTILKRKCNEKATCPTIRIYGNALKQHGTIARRDTNGASVQPGPQTGMDLRHSAQIGGENIAGLTNYVETSGYPFAFQKWLANMAQTFSFSY